MKKILGMLASAVLFNTIAPAEGIKKIVLEEDSVDFEVQEFDTDIFWEILPWKDNSSVTIDGWGRYSVLNFNKAGTEIIQKKMCGYPKNQYDRIFYADDKTGFVIANSAMMVHVYNEETKIKNSFVPVLSWKGHSELFPLDQKNILVKFSTKDKNAYFIYEHSSEEYECRSEFDDIRSMKLRYQFYDDKYLFIAEEDGKYFIYDWKNQKKSDSRLTDFLNSTEINKIDFDMKNRKVVVKNEEGTYVLFWNEDLSEITSYNLNDFLSSDSYNLRVFSFSGDGRYAFAAISAYDDEYETILYHLSFIDFDALKEGKKNPIVPSTLITDRNGSFFTTGFLYSEKKGWAFIFADSDSKANAIFLDAM